MIELRVGLFKFGLEVRNADLITMDTVQPTLQNIDGIVDNFSKCAHG